MFLKNSFGPQAELGGGLLARELKVWTSLRDKFDFFADMAKSKSHAVLLDLVELPELGKRSTVAPIARNRRKTDNRNMDDTKNEIPEVVAEPVEPDEIEGEAETDDDDDDGSVFGPLYLGPPFAFEGGINLLKEHGGKPGSTSICQCENCGQLFRIDLLDGAVKHCPKCRTPYTHCLIVSRLDDDSIFEETIEHVIEINKGLRDNVPDDDDDDENGDDGPGAEIPDAEG